MTARREWLGVGLIVLVGAVAASVFALQLVEYVIMPDELSYLKQGIQLSHGELPHPGAIWFTSWALLRPLTIAPAYKLFATPTAFDVAHITGAVLMASTAIPAYLLARRVTRHGIASLVVAALSVFVPWLCMAGSMMSEVVAYPAFTWATLAMVHAIETPGWRSDALFVFALAVAFLARTQLVILAPVFVAAVVLDACVRRAGGSSLPRRLASTARAHGVLLAGGVLVLAVGAATASLKRFLGGYAEPAAGSLFPPGSGHAMHELSAYVVVGIGVVPLALAVAWVVVELIRGAPAGAAPATFLCLAAVLTIVGGTFTVRYTAGINDRYLFYVAPLLFTASAAFLVSAPRDLLWRVAGVAGAAFAFWLVWTSQLAQHGPSLVSPTMAFHDVLSARGSEVGLSGPHLAAVVGVAAAVGALLVPRRVGAAGVAALLLAFGVTETIYTFEKLAATQASAGKTFLDNRNAIDRMLPANARVAAVLAPVGDLAGSVANWWDVTFWNKSVDTVYTPGGETYDLGSALGMPVDPQTGRIPALDKWPFVVRIGSDTRFGLHASQTVGSAGAFEVVKADRPYRVDWFFHGPDPNSATVAPATSASVRVYGSPGRRTVQLVLGAPAPGPVTIAIGRRRVVLRAAARTARNVTLDLVRGTDPAIGHADLRIAVPRGGHPVTLLAAAA